LFKHDADVDVAVELPDLAVFHVPKSAPGTSSLALVGWMTLAGDSNGTGEGAPDRQLDRDDVPHDVNPMEFPVNVGSQLAHEHHHVAQLLTAVALLAGVEANRSMNPCTSMTLPSAVW
jgi:hypothetical protein